MNGLLPGSFNYAISVEFERESRQSNFRYFPRAIYNFILFLNDIDYSSILSDFEKKISFLTKAFFKMFTSNT